jgi:hypothetical protein
MLITISAVTRSGTASNSRARAMLAARLLASRP